MRREFNRGRGDNAKKEKIVMIATSAFVLAALTMTGVYVRNTGEKDKNDGYQVDFGALEDGRKEDAAANQPQIQEDSFDGYLPPYLEDDLDYTPMEQVDSDEIEIPGLTDDDNLQSQQNHEEKPISSLQEEAQAAGQAQWELDAAMDQAAIEADALAQIEGTGEIPIIEQPQPDFRSGDALVWPVSGSVLIPYSMEKTVYFPTLAQYKCNPGVVISATEGEAISASAAGKVVSIFYDEEIGNAVRVEIGNGYEVTYGQLKDIAVTEGSYIEKGSIIGYVTKPTKYYCVEGVNVYFALTLNGKAVDPMGELQ